MVFQRTHIGKQGRNVTPDDAPQGIVVDAEITVDQPVASGDNEPPRNLRIGGTRCVESDTDRFLFNEWPQLHTQGFVGHQNNWGRSQFSHTISVPDVIAVERGFIAPSGVVAPVVRRGRRRRIRRAKAAPYN